MRLRHPEPFGPTWRGRWIWPRPPAIVTETATRPVQSDPVDRIGLLRRRVTLDVVPERAWARLWCDGRYVLWVNGVEAARGPVRSDPRAARYDVVDLAPHLREGENVLAVVVRHFGAATSWWVPVPPTYSLGAGCFVFEALIADRWVVSDASWEAADGEAWTPVPVPGDVACLPLESFDARHLDARWTDAPAAGSDPSWRPATEIAALHTGGHASPHPPSEPFGALRPPVRQAFPSGATRAAQPAGHRSAVGGDPLADPVVQVLADQAAAEPGDVTLLRFDLGGISVGTVVLDVAGATAGTVLDVAASEHLGPSGELVPLGQHAGFRYVCRGGAERFESFDLVGGRHLHVSVRSPGGAPVPDVALAVQERHRPRPPGASFACSDPLLEEIHRVGLRTVDLCALDAYVDCPTREQRAWTGDSVVHQMVDLVANPDWSMARWHPELATMSRSDGMLAMAPASDFAADDRTFIPDWSLHWLHSVHNLFRYLGDREAIADLLAVAGRVLRWFETYLDDRDLLADVTGWSLLDWSSVYPTGASSVLNALWGRGLAEYAEMSRWLGNDGEAEWALGHHRRLRAAFGVFWDDGRGVYVDHVVDGSPSRAAAQHGGAAAICADLVPPARLARVVDRLSDRQRLVRHSWVMDTVRVGGDSSGFVHLLMGYPEPDWDVEEQMVQAQPFFHYVVHDAYARAGRADLVADSCRQWATFLEAGETTWPECWVGGTRCHGWSSTPTRDLIVHVLGIQPASPGYGSVRVAPALGDLAWARATVPSPHGPITVEAHADGHLEIDSPVPVVREVREAGRP